MGTRCVYNWTETMVEMGLDNIVHHDREPYNARIFNACIKEQDSEILRTRYHENDQHLLQKHKNLRCL